MHNDHSWLENSLGFYQIINNKYLIFFGKRNTTINLLTKQYPHLKFTSLKQTHSDICIDSSLLLEQETEADAHYTHLTGVALIIKTADCMPVLVFDSNVDKILAIHAGWRGVENQIISKSLQKCNFQNPSLYIGPHILMPSFEIDAPVFNLLLSRAKNCQTSFLDSDLFYTENSKFYFDLFKLINLEITSLKLNSHIYTLLKNTVTDLEFNSYRRNKENSQRNLSFIAKLN